MKLVLQMLAIISFTTSCTAQTSPQKAPELHALCSETKAISKLRPQGYLEDFQQIDLILVSKDKHMTYAFSGNQLIFAFKSNFGMTFKTGPKTQEGDKKTPEGIYHISAKNINSKYFRSLKIDYPNDYDKAFAAEKGVSPGDDIMFHGLPNGLDEDETLAGFVLNKFNWTAGCIAMGNDNIQALFNTVKVGTPVAICPK